MLVLTRHVNESIVIRGDIIVTVVGHNGDKVRLGIDAPKDVPIDRHEIHLLRQQGITHQSKGATS